MRRTAVVVVGFAIVLGGCGSSNDESETTPPAADSTPTTSAGEEKAGALQGTWRTDPITVADMAKTLREAKLAESIRSFKRNAPISDAPTRLTWRSVRAGGTSMAQPGPGAREEIDYDAQYEVDGDVVVASHEGDSNTYRWSVNDDVLSLSWIKTTYEPNQGIPEEVFQRALYMTADFHRAR